MSAAPDGWDRLRSEGRTLVHGDGLTGERGRYGSLVPDDNDDQLTRNEIKALLRIVTTTTDPGARTDVSFGQHYALGIIKDLSAKLRRMLRHATQRYIFVNLMGNVGPRAQVCVRCGGVVPDTNEWRMLHDEWHDSIEVDEA